MITASFNEVVKNVTMVSLGSATGATWVWNKDYWTGLSPEHRALIVEEMMRGLVAQQLTFARLDGESLQDAKDRGIVLEEPGEDLAAHLESFKAHWAEQLLAQANAITDPQAILDAYSQAQARWTEDLKKVDRTDPEAVFGLVQQNLLSKIDPASYGL